MKDQTVEDIRILCKKWMDREMGYTAHNTDLLVRALVIMLKKYDEQAEGSAYYVMSAECTDDGNIRPSLYAVCGDEVSAERAVGNVMKLLDMDICRGEGDNDEFANVRYDYDGLTAYDVRDATNARCVVAEYVNASKKTKLTMEGKAYASAF